MDEELKKPGLFPDKAKRYKQAKDIVERTGFDAKKSLLVRHSLDRFTGDDYKLIRHLETEGKDLNRDYNTSDLDLRGEQVNTTKEINDFLDKAPKYQGEIYRGMVIPDSDLNDFLSSMEKGVSITAMSSHSKSKDVAMSFTRTLDKTQAKVLITVKKNRSGVDIESFSTKPEEEEVLVPSGSAFRSTNIKQSKGSDGITTYEIEVEEMDSDRLLRGKKKSSNMDSIGAASNSSSAKASRFVETDWRKFLAPVGKDGNSSSAKASRFVETDWRKFLAPVGKDARADRPKQDSLNSRIDTLRDRLKQK